MKLRKIRSCGLIILILFSFFYVTYHIPIPEIREKITPEILNPNIAEAQVTYTEGFEDGDYNGWLMSHCKASRPQIQITTTKVHSGSYALNLTDFRSDIGPFSFLTKGFPQSGLNNFTVSIWFLADIDLSLDARVMLALGTNGSTVLYAGWRVTDGLIIGLVTYADVSPTDSAIIVQLTNKSYDITVDTWYKLEAVWTPDNKTQVRLYNSTGDLLANTTYLDIPSDFTPSAQGFGISGGSTQVGSIIFDDFTITWESTQTTYVEPIIYLSPTQYNPDLGTWYDWVGAPYIFKLSNGTWLMTVRWHGEFLSTDGSGIDTDENGSGERIDLYKSNDEGKTWIFVKELFRRTDFGWSKMEKASLVVLSNGSWLCYVAYQDGTDWQIRLLRSNDEGDTWTDVGAVTPLGTKYPHSVLLSNGTLLFGYADYAAPKFFVNKSNDYIDFSQGLAVFSGYKDVSFTLASDGWYYLVFHTLYGWDDFRGRVVLPTSLNRTKNFKTFETVKAENLTELGGYLTLDAGGFSYGILIEINNSLYLYGETRSTDHDKNDDIIDKTQRHLARLRDPVYNITVPTAATSSIPGTLTVGYASPEVLSINLYNTTWYEVSSIDPYVEYWLNMTIRHNNTLYALKNITIYMYADGYSWDSADDPNTHATFLWDNSTKQYSLVGPSGTTWGVNTANCRVPDQSQSTGTFTLAFNASKIALMGTWYINVTVWGAQDLSDNLTASFTVNFYAELNLIDSSFQFSLDVGAVNGSLVSPTDGNLNFTVICNTQYNISFYTNGNWTSDGNEIDITNTNYFIGDDDADPTDTTEGGSISEFAIHPTPYETTPYANVAVTQDDINGDAYAIYLFQTVPSGTALGTYTLILYIEVISA